jgi:glycerol-3-phosphate responsive antiterminator
MSNLISPAVISELREKFGDQVTSGELFYYNPKVLTAARKGALVQKARGVFSLVGEVENKIKKKSAQEIEAERFKTAEEIESRFEALELLSDGIIGGKIRSLIVSGAAGVGKSYTLEQKLNAALANDTIKQVTHIKGTISPIGLYMTLWENNKKGDIIVLDDIDSIFNDEEAMNLLKGALDSNGRRVISWIKDSRFLEERDIPNSFEYKGQVVFLTNVDLQSVFDKGGRMAVHMGALMSRACYLDLGIHTAEQIMIRIRQVLKVSDMGLGLTAAQVQQILDWMDGNITNLRAISLRTVIQCAGFMKISKDWQLLARNTLLRTR